MPDKILAVDDNKEFCQNVADIMELKGYEVTMANDGTQAIELVKKNKYNLVIMDIKMPGMNGVDVFREIKKISPSTVIILMTAYALEDLKKEALREGVFASLRKPLNFDELFVIVEDAISQKTMILVADDDENLCANLKDILDGKGYKICTAYDGSTALETTGKYNFNIMLLDIKLPPLNGLETFVSIREIRPNLTAIVITGYFKELNKLVEQALEKGAYTCLEKPVNIDELISLIEQIKDKKNKGKL
jgi:DNA-binding NtrC family response regulator